MIIVSQDKKIITNFNNTIGLQINEHILNSDGEGDFEIRAITEKRDCVIAFYATEERAKEVLEEIYIYRALFEYFKYVPEDVKDQISEDFINDDVMFDAYEMPLE